MAYVLKNGEYIFNIDSYYEKVKLDDNEEIINSFYIYLTENDSLDDEKHNTLISLVGEENFGIYNNDDDVLVLPILTSLKEVTRSLGENDGVQMIRTSLRFI